MKTARVCKECGKKFYPRYEKNEDNHTQAIVGVASGYFNPLHMGHIEYLNKARRLCDKLIVIVNNDKQVRIKGSKSFMNEKERMEIIKNLNAVDEAILSIDKDKSVKKTLAQIKPAMFLKGGDKYKDNIPESDICKKEGIKIIDGLGKKIRSSSELVKEWQRQEKSGKRCSKK